MEVPSQSPHFNLDVKRLNRRRRMGSLAAGVLVLFVVLFSAPSPDNAMLRLSLGVLVILAGIALRMWAFCSIEGCKKRRLVTWGAYGHFRHPLYWGSSLLILGFAVLSGSLLAAALACLAFAMLYLPAIQAEEALLAAQFGEDWETYCRQVGRFTVRFGAPLAARPMTLALRPPLREMGKLAVFSLAALALLAAVRALRRAHDLPDWFW